MSSPEEPHSIESTGPEQNVMASGGQMYVQSQEIQPSFVQNNRMVSFSTQSVRVTSALPQTTMCPGIQESQTLQQHQSRHTDHSIMQPSSLNLQPSLDQHQLWWDQHSWDQHTRLLNYKPTGPGHYIDHQSLQPQTVPFIGRRQSGSYPRQTHGIYNTQILPQMYQQGQSSDPYFSSLHLNWSQQTNGTEHRSTHPRGSQFLSENITRNVTCRQMTEQALLQSHHLGISQSPHTQVYSSENRNIQPLGSELHLQQSPHHQTFHQWLPEPLLSTTHSGSLIHDIESYSNETMYQSPPQKEPQSMSHLEPEISNTHEGETSQYFIIHCQHGSYSVQKFSIFYLYFVVLSPITLAMSHPVQKPSRVSKENHTNYFSHKNTFFI